MYKKIISFIIIIVLLMFSLTGCFFPYSNKKDKIQSYINDPTLFETDYFDCIEYRGDIAICRLTQKGYEAKEIIIPEKIHGKNVKYLGDPYGNPEHSPLSFFKELEKLFIDARDLESISLDFEVSETHVPKVIMMRDQSVYNYLDRRYKDAIKLYLSITVIPFAIEPLIPNIGYFFNKDGQENRYEDEVNYFRDYYWCDDVGIGEKINTIPPVSEREGYIFDGWYTEPEYINLWDFQEGIPFAEDFIFNGDSPDFALFGRWIDEGESL